MHPPRLFLRFFRWFCHPQLQKYIEGDLMELYAERLKISGKKTADLKFIVDVVLLFRRGIIRPVEKYHYVNNNAMFKNYFKIGWRNLLKNKGYSFINIGGLAVGMSVAMLIGLWIQFESGFDSFHQNADHIALVQKHTLFNNERNTQESTPFPLHDELKRNYPEVKRASRLSWRRDRNLVTGEKKFIKSGRYVDPDFLGMFSFPLVKGDVKTALEDPNSIILTESLAGALFGTEDPIGKSIRVDNEHDVQVTAVMKDIPKNSTLQFEFLAPYEYEVQNDAFIRNNTTNWGNNFMMNVVELHKGNSMEAFSKKISTLNMDRDKSIKDQFLFLHPLKKWHLYNDYKNWVNVGGKIEYVRLFAIIGIFVLLIACINFMNLSTARSQKRAREVGIRKAMGSQRVQVIAQFLSESMITTFFAFLVSLCLMLLVWPYLKEFGFENITWDVGNGSLLALGFLICILTGFIAGSYPALYLSSFLPVGVLKGIFKSDKSPVTFRRVLVVCQFTISISLIISTIVVFKQIDYARDRSVGYNPDNLISVPGSNDIFANFAVIKQALLNSGSIEAVAKASSPMTAVYNKWSDFSWDGKDPNSQIALEALMTEWDFEKAAGLKFKLGRPFSIEHGTDSNAVILNETALKIIGYEDPIGKTMKSGNREITIVGVVEDVLMLDPFKPVSPGVILFNADVGNAILIRVKKDVDLKETLAAIEPTFEKYNPSQPFEYTFVDDEFAKKFTIENQVGKLSGVFAILAVFISCLGLFGLASFMAEQRTKEIGIRKILGASVSNLWRMLSKDFVILTLISCLIAAPIAYYFVSNWLQKYDYRTGISWWIFALVGVGVLFIALATVSYQAIKAALVNPVNSLRSE